MRTVQGRAMKGTNDGRTRGETRPTKTGRQAWDGKTEKARRTRKEIKDGK